MIVNVPSVVCLVDNYAITSNSHGTALDKSHVGAAASMLVSAVHFMITEVDAITGVL